MTTRIATFILATLLLATVGCLNLDDDDDTVYEEENLFVDISIGNHHGCAIRANGEIECWGQSCQFDNYRPDGTYISLDSGYYHTCAISDTDRHIDCWFDNHADGRAIPPDGTDYAQLYVGKGNCAIKSNGNVQCWGNVPHTPDELLTDLSVGMNNVCIVRPDGDIGCWGEGMDVDIAPDQGKTFIQVESGYNFACGLQNDGKVQCWMADDVEEEHFQATPPTYAEFTQISAGHSSSCGITDSGTTILCWGRDQEPSTDITPYQGKFIKVSCGTTNACALQENGRIFCWGMHQGTPPPQ